MFFRVFLALLLSFSCVVNADSQYNYESALSLYQQQKYDVAIIHLRNVLKNNPDNLSAQILLGKILLQQQHFSQALNVFEGALTDGADVNLLSDELSYIYLLQQDETKLLQLPRYGVLSNAKRFTWLLMTSNLYQQADKHAEASQSLHDAEQLFADHTSLLNAKAGLAIKLGDYDSARHLLQRSLNQTPDNVEALLLSGHLARQQQHTEQAVKFYQRAIAIEADNPFVLRALSATWLSLAELQKAKPLLLKLQDMGLNDPYLRFSLLMVNAVQQNKPAATNFASLRDDLSAMPMEYFTAEPAQLYLRAALNYLLGATEQAIQDLEAYLKLKPSDTNAISLLAEHYLQTREQSMTLRFLERNQDYIQNSVPLLAQYVLLTIQAGKLQSAQTLLANIRSRFPTDATLAALNADLNRRLYGASHAQKELSTQQTPVSAVILLTQALLALDLADYVGASEYAGKLIALAPDNADYLNLYAGVLLQDQKLQLAAQQLQQLFQIQPTHFAGRLTLANLYLTQQQFAEAETVLTKLLDEQPQHQATTVLLAAAELQLGKKRQAEQRLTDLLNLKYYRPAVDVLLNYYEKTNAFGNARYLLQRALRQEFLAKDLLFRETGILIALKDIAQAKEKIKLIQGLPDLTSEHWLTLGKLQQQLGLQQDALQSLATAVQLAPERPHYDYEYIAMLLAYNELSLANQRLSTLKKRADNSADVDLLSAAYASARGDNVQAVALLQSSINKDPKFRRAWANLYELARQPAFNKDFVAIAQQHLALTPDDVWLRRLLAEHHINHQAFAEAKQHYRQLLADGHFAQDPWLYNNLANTLLADAPEQALTYAEQAEQLLYNNPTIQLTHAKALRALQQHDNALKVLRQAFAIDSTNAEINYLLADSLVKLDRADEARNILRNVAQTSETYRDEALTLLKTIDASTN